MEWHETYVSLETAKLLKQAAFDYINSDVVKPENAQLAFGDFINGAKWADKHHK